MYGLAMHQLLFELESEVDNLSKIEFDKTLGELFELEQPGKFMVVLHNDPLNNMDFVVGVIKEVFGYSTSKSIWLMLKAHFKGKSSLWSGEKKVAIEKRNLIISFGPDPTKIRQGAEPIKVTVEPIE